MPPSSTSPPQVIFDSSCIPLLGTGPPPARPPPPQGIHPGIPYVLTPPPSPTLSTTNPPPCPIYFPCSLSSSVSAYATASVGQCSGSHSRRCLASIQEGPPNQCPCSLCNDHLTSSSVGTLLVICEGSMDVGIFSPGGAGVIAR